MSVPAGARTARQRWERRLVADGELLRLVDSIHRDKNIDREVLFQGIESALLTAVRKSFTVSEDLQVTIDRETGEIRASDGDQLISTDRLGRIAAQTAKQVILQKLREAESDVLFGEYEHRKGSVVSGVVARAESGAAIVNIGQTEGVLPASEQMPTESYRAGDRLRAIVLDVRRVGSRVRVVLSRTHPQLVRELFRLEVPEVNDGTVEIKALVREAGYRTKIAVASNDSKVDSTGACVGVRGSRIKSIVDELGGEKIDVIRWSDSADVLIRSCLKPAEVSRLVLDAGLALALAVVPEDQLSLAIGRRGQNVRLASRLTGWDIEIVTPEEAGRIEQAVLTELQGIEGVDERGAQALLGAGCLSARSVILLSDEDFKLLLATDPEGAEAMRKWVEEHLPGGADHLPIYQQVLAQFEAQAAAAQAQAAREAAARAAELAAKAQAQAEVAAGGPVAEAEAEVPAGQSAVELEGAEPAAAEGGPLPVEPAPAAEPTGPAEGGPSAVAAEGTSAAAVSAGEAEEASVGTEIGGSAGAATPTGEASAEGAEGSAPTQTGEGSPAGEEGAAESAEEPPASAPLPEPPGPGAGGEEVSGAASGAAAADVEEQPKPQGGDSMQNEGTGSGGPEVSEPGER